jgi:dienelactone hydrolase
MKPLNRLLTMFVPAAPQFTEVARGSGLGSCVKWRGLAVAGVMLGLLWQSAVRADARPGEPPLAAPAVVLPAGAAPPIAGESVEVVTQDLDWFDKARQRAVPVRLYLPPGHDADRALPLVVFSHGIGGSRRGYSYLGRYFASQGYASLHLQHVGSDRSLWAGSMLGLVGRLQNAAQEDEAIARVGDLRFALDQVLGNGALGVRIDAARIVAAGHSYGANTMLLAVGARVERNGRVIELADARLKAAIILSAPPFYGESDPAKILSAIRVPTLHITATEDVIRIPGFYSGAEDRVAVYEAISGARKLLAVFEGGSHSMFTDRGGSGGVTLNPQVKNATRELSLAFMKSVFEREETGLTLWPKRFAAILARFTASER